MIPLVDLFSFVFWKKLKTPKRRFEINWPLAHADDFPLNFSDDGLIQQSDLREVIKACMDENGMRFDDKEVEELATALYEDAAGLAAGESALDSKGITTEDLKAELSKHDGLLENLSLK